MRKLRNAFRIGFYNVFFDVGRFVRRTLAACKNLEKTAVSGSTIDARGVLGISGEHVRVPKRPSGTKKRVRSTSGASENFLVGANEATSSEKGRPEPPKSARGPEDPEA